MLFLKMLLFTVQDMRKKNYTFKSGTLFQYSSKEPKHRSKQTHLNPQVFSLIHLREKLQGRRRKIFDLITKNNRVTEMRSREKKYDMLKEQTLQKKQKQLKERGKYDQLKEEGKTFMSHFHHIRYSLCF